MKVYFSAAIAQQEKYGQAYKEIVQSLMELGHDVYQDTTIVTLEEAINKSDDERVSYYKQVQRWIAKCDVAVFEVSFPSTLNIGHEMSLVLEKGKPLIAFYQKGFEPSFFLGREDEKLFWSDYELGNIKERLHYLVDLAVTTADARFNFFISPKHMAYLDWVAQTKKIPRSVYLRQLIEDDREQNREFSES